MLSCKASKVTNEKRQFFFKSVIFGWMDAALVSKITRNWQPLKKNWSNNNASAYASPGSESASGFNNMKICPKINLRCSKTFGGPLNEDPGATSIPSHPSIFRPQGDRACLAPPSHCWAKAGHWTSQQQSVNLNFSCTNRIFSWAQRLMKEEKVHILACAFYRSHILPD